MRWLVFCCSVNCTVMRSKILFGFNFSLLVLLYLFFDAINSTYSHNVNNHLNSFAKESASDYILCRFCGGDLADAKHIINHLSPEASVIANQTIFERKGVEVQLLKNPLGIKFHSIVLSNSKCAAVRNWQQNFSWYPGYAWKPCICKHCRIHHGWLFEPIETASSNFPSPKGFYVLKLNNLLSENFADSLIVIPKSYMN